MKHMNKTSSKSYNDDLDTLLKEALECTEKPSLQLKNRLLADFQSRPIRHSCEGISIWWLPAALAALFTFMVIAVLPCFLSGSPLLPLLCAVSLFFCANSWLMTLIGLKHFNLKEVASV